MTTTIWHNPRCSKSRQTLALLQQQGIEPVIVRYLETPPTIAQLDQALTQLGIEPLALIRRQEALFAELGLKDAELSRQQWLAIMTQHPKLIERPVVLHQGKACIGRPPENVLALL
ncbi:arsenate reductase (glutaredoxin) [Ferrimonas senticii]|uniref:arsenate reductase (glutaredoxin) n=1 Tax=Ferrimonas senticii TaxID=394566 RepID=UPI000403EC9F|nr:arsenate reductase (glutaredoxin) [Ferrimonas senticii]